MIRLISRRDANRQKGISERKLRKKYKFLRNAVIQIPKHMAPIKRND